MNRDDALQVLDNIRRDLREGLHEGPPDDLSDRKEVYERYQAHFRPGQVEKIGEETFISFLNNKNNKHWSGLHRRKTKLTRDMEALREGLSVLVDETRPIGPRFTEALEKVDGLGKGTATAVLHVAYPEQYGVWNGTSEDAMETLGLLPDFERGASTGEKYGAVNEVLLSLAEELSTDLWTLDFLWARVDQEEISRVRTSPKDSGSVESEQLISDALEEVLETYLSTRQSEPFGKTDEDGQKRRIWRLFEEITSEMEGSSALSQRPHVQVKWSVGQGNWARVPWIAFLDKRETETTREGVYVVYLFRQDMSGVYLTYNQGVTRPTKTYGQDVGYAFLRSRAERLRRQASSLEEDGFSLDRGIDLAADRGLGQDYEVSTVGYKLYEPGSIPSDETLLSDLDSAIRAYDSYVSRSEKRLVEPEDIDRERLKSAVENVIRPAILDRGDLDEEGRMGHIHHRIVPETASRLTPEALESNPREAVIGALGSSAGLLAEEQQREVAMDFFRRTSPEKIHEEVSSLLHGEKNLSDRAERFLKLGEKVEANNGTTTIEIDLDVASYLLAFSDPEEHAFCRMSAYRPAVEALLGGKENGSYHWHECIAHARDFYKSALEIFREEHEELPFEDLLHVHAAFDLAANEDRDAPWGAGAVELEEDGYQIPGGLPSDERQVVKISPGEGAKLWDDCLENNHIRVGWGDVGSLRQFESEDQFAQAFEDAFLGDTYDEQSTTTKKARELWMLRGLGTGDLVVANRGKSEVLAVGTVVEPGYEWKSGYDSHNHAVHVDWDTTYAQEIPEQSYWGMVTVRKLTDEGLVERILRPDEAVESESSYQPPPFERIYEAVQASDMILDRRTLRRYHVSLQTRGFVVLSGPSGTGKTWLTELYAGAVGAEYLPQPVSPNWTTDEDLLGYYNPVEGEYHHTDVSRFLQEAEEAYKNAEARGHRPRPYHLLLDEMNLARVEYYFAKFLSKMERRQRGESTRLKLGPDSSVLLPPNLSVVGTVNIDETTHDFADKVYDRAQLIEMEAPRRGLAKKLEGKPYKDTLLSVWDAVSGASPFAFRVLEETAEYVNVAERHGASWEEALDEQLLQKVLPKVKGTERAVETALKGFLDVLDEERFPLSCEKARAMQKDFQNHGFASYF